MMRGAVAVIYREDGRQERIGMLLSEPDMESIDSQVLRKITMDHNDAEGPATEPFVIEPTQTGYVIKYKHDRSSEYAIVTLLDRVLV